MDQKFIQACTELLQFLPENLEREGLHKTPERMARALTELTEGYSQNLDEICNGAIFQERCSEMIVVRDIQFFSLCEHHLLPFFGRAHVAYVPNGKILGLSKIPRIVEMFSRRLQVQERLTEQVAESVNEAIGPLGVGCVIEAFHLCTMMRGVRLPSTNMVTSALRGVFLGDSRTRAEFFQLVRSEERRVP